MIGGPFRERHANAPAVAVSNGKSKTVKGNDGRRAANGNRGNAVNANNRRKATDWNGDQQAANWDAGRRAADMRHALSEAALPRGFRFAATACGLKKTGALD